MLMIKSSYWVDQALFNFLFNSSEILYVRKSLLKVLIQVQTLKLVEKVIHIFFI